MFSVFPSFSDLFCFVLFCSLFLFCSFDLFIYLFFCVYVFVCWGATAQPQVQNMDPFQTMEVKDGTRFTWNVLPTTHLESTRMAIPLACVYTPMKPIANMESLSSPPVLCRAASCGCVLNPYCRVDFINKLWMCPLCRNRNHFPTGYTLSAQERPHEILQANTTLEYVLDARPLPPTFLFVIDLCNFDEEIVALREAITQNLMCLPENAYVGLISFGRNVYIHQLRSEETPHFVVLNGAKEYKSADLPKILGIATGTNGAGAESKFLVPLAEFELTITNHLEQLRADCWPFAKGQRWSRSVGTAMAVAVSLMANARKGQPGRIMAFISGPSTFGPALIVETDLKNRIRSHHDILKNQAPHYRTTCSFYEKLADELKISEHICDVFACGLDQFGLAEMRVLVERTGGYMVLICKFIFL